MTVQVLTQVVCDGAEKLSGDADAGVCTPHLALPGFRTAFPCWFPQNPGVQQDASLTMSNKFGKHQVKQS